MYTINKKKSKLIHKMYTINKKIQTGRGDALPQSWNRL